MRFHVSDLKCFSFTVVKLHDILAFFKEYILTREVKIHWKYHNTITGDSLFSPFQNIHSSWRSSRLISVKWNCIYLLWKVKKNSLLFFYLYQKASVAKRQCDQWGFKKTRDYSRVNAIIWFSFIFIENQRFWGTSKYHLKFKNKIFSLYGINKERNFHYWNIKFKTSFLSSTLVHINHWTPLGFSWMKK